MMQAKTDGSAGNRMMVVSLLAVLMTTVLMLTAKPAYAANFTVTNTNDSGAGSLRQAILNANNTPGPDDVITFNISGTGVKTIRPSEKLPLITEAVTINGYSQPGASVNTLSKGTNAKIMIALDGSGTVGNGLEIVADDVVVQGLAIGRFANGIEIDEVEGLGEPSGVRIEGNFLGTDASGTAARPNRFNGLNLVASGGNNSIGGISRFQRNLISANGANGVDIIPSRNTDVEVEGNLIGTKKDGAAALGNDTDGVSISSSSENFVGGFSSGAPNTIAFNGGDGVNVVSDDADGNHILRNSIFSNGGLAIDLVGGTENAIGATVNDPKDPDEGPNGLQNKPVLTSATNSAGKTTIEGRLNSTPTDPFVVEFYSNPSGNEGKKFIGNKFVATDSRGIGSFTFIPLQKVPLGHTVTATATNSLEANTSEFSRPRPVAAQ